MQTIRPPRSFQMPNVRSFEHVSQKMTRLQKMFSLWRK